MTFYIDKLLLWLKDGSLRTLKFSNDKVNVITGNSKTGKTAILEIIDYCLCGGQDTVVISYEHIAENVKWYGIRFVINDKTYTIARGEISEKGEFSNNYYFSQTGEIPDVPCTKLDQKGIKEILEQEFAIDDEITLSHGGKSVKKNTRLSFRYFLMLNTLSKDVVDNGKMFFDKLTLDRYRDVWHQIFDLSLGVITPESLAIQKQINDLHQDIETLESAKKKAEKQGLLHKQQLLDLVKKAKEACLIDEALDDDEAIEELQDIIENGIRDFVTNFSIGQQYEKLLAQRDDVAIRLAKLKRFKQSYSEYRERMRLEQDALSPITYIQNQFSDRTQGEYRQFLDHLSAEFTRIKSAISEKRPFERDVDRQIKQLKAELNEINGKLGRAPKVEYRAIPAAQKLISLGEIRADYKHVTPCEENPDAVEEAIKKKQQTLDELETQQATVGETRALVTNTLNEFIQYYIKAAKDALDEYGDYKAWFDYKKSSLFLKRNQAATVANISSSSDHLFLHLCLFAGLHNMLLMEQSKYVPSFLIIDQPSRPYFNTQDYNYAESEASIAKKDDWSKVQSIFTLWDKFFDVVLTQKKHFQIIMLEHVSESAWTNCKHVNLVEIFDGAKNALIPPTK